MHDILEGALQYEVKLMLRRMVEIDKYFTLGMHIILYNSLIQLTT